MSAEWKEYRLGDITEWTSGGTPSKAKDEYWNGDIPWISASSMYGNRFGDSALKITNSGLKAGSRLASKDSILLLVRGSSLHQRVPVGIATRDVSFNQDVKALKVDESIVDPWFMLFWFMSKEKDLLHLVSYTGIGAGKFDTKQIQDLMVLVPPEEERKRIVSFAKAVDDKILLNNQINQTLEQITQTIFKSWFVDFDPVKAKIEAKAAGRDPGRAAMCAISGKLEPELDQLPPEQYQQLAATAALFPDELVESELGLIPVGWKTKKVESLLARLSSKVRYTKDQVKPYGVTPVFEQGSGILLGYHDGAAQFLATPEEPAFIFGDHTCVTHLAFEPFDISQNVISIKGSDRSTIWVYYAVKDKQVFQEYRRHWMELIVKDVVVPPETVCQAFAEIATSFHLALEANTLQNRELAELRNNLLPKLLSGELTAERLPMEATA